MVEVSIIIPAYNRLELLEQNILSCLSQTFTGCEVLVIDDGSEMKLEPAIEKISRANHSPIPIRYFRQEHAGANSARNLGVRKANGKYVQFLDSDDLLHPKKIEIQKQILDADPDLQMCYCLNEHFRKTPGDMNLIWNLSDQPFHLERLLWFDHVWQTGSPLWRKSAFEKIEWWNEDLICLQEWEFHLKALAKKIRYIHIPYVLQYIREHDKPRSANLSPLVKYQESVRTAVRSGYEYLQKCNLLTTDRADALSAILLASADGLIRCGFKHDGLATLDLADQYAKGVCFRNLSRWMQFAAQNRILWMIVGRFVRRILSGIVVERAGLFMKSSRQQNQLIQDGTITVKIAHGNPINESVKPIASIIIPLFEHSPRLKSLLKDLFDQSTNSEDYEIVIVSPFPEEQTVSGCELEGNQFRNIRYIKQHFRNNYHARYIGAQAAKGQILAFVHVENRVDKEWLLTYIKAFLRHPFISAAGGPINPDWEQPPEQCLQGLIQDFPAFNFNSGTKFFLTPDSCFLGKNLAISRNVFLQMKLPELGQPDSSTFKYPEINLLQQFYRGALLFAYLPEAAVTQWIPASKMTLDSFQDCAKRWGLSIAHGQNFGSKKTRLELFYEVWKQLARFILFYFLISPRTHSKTAPDYVRWRMEKASAFQQILFTWRLIFNSDLRKEVQIPNIN